MQKTAYVMRISDWSSDVCSSDLLQLQGVLAPAEAVGFVEDHKIPGLCREEAWQVLLALDPVHGRDDTVVQLPVGVVRNLEVGSVDEEVVEAELQLQIDRKSTRLNSSH